MTTCAQIAPLIPLEYGQEHPMEVRLQIHAVEEFNPMQLQISKTKPISATTAQPTQSARPISQALPRHIRFTKRTQFSFIFNSDISSRRILQRTAQGQAPPATPENEIQLRLNCFTKRTQGSFVFNGDTEQAHRQRVHERLIKTLATPAPLLNTSAPNQADRIGRPVRACRSELRRRAAGGYEGSLVIAIGTALGPIRGQSEPRQRRVRHIV
jgi:hypothetical protein